MPLVAYPRSAPRDDENAQRLCMSGANAGLSILFFAMHASIVTSAMATPVEIPTKQSTAEVTGNPVTMATAAAEVVPSIPTITIFFWQFISARLQLLFDIKVRPSFLIKGFTVLAIIRIQR
jgi:hypothetical protein